MHVLVLGGTRFVGRHIVKALLAAGHAVSTFNRGTSPDSLPAGVEGLRGDRDAGVAGLQALATRTWDACVDVCGYTPTQVRPSAELLAGRVNRYVFVSAVSVYGDPRSGPVSEAQPRQPPAGEDVTDVTSDTYGPLKVACENIVEQIYGPRCTLLRPQIVAGPHDPYDRFSYWVRRTAQPGPMLAPGDGSDPLQVIDARDVARFAVTVIEQNLSGSFNLSGSRPTWAEFLEMLGAQDLVWVPARILQTAGITEQQLPLFRPDGGPRSSLMHVSHAKATAAGLTLTPLEITARDTREWLQHHDLSPALTLEQEAKLLQLARQEIT